MNPVLQNPTFGIITYTQTKGLLMILGSVRVPTNSLVRTKCRSEVYDVCKRTDLHFAPSLSKLTGNRVFLKREGLSRVLLVCHAHSG